MAIFAVVPVKSFNRSKSRLADSLSAPERQALSESLLIHTLTSLLRSSRVQGVIVVTPDRDVLNLAGRFDAVPLQEPGAGDLNLALHLGSDQAVRLGATGVLVLPADLPMLDSSAIERLIQRLGPPPSLVLVPDRHVSGTNALLMAPAGLIEYAFGPMSFERHRQMAERTGAQVQVCDEPSLSLDLDVPEDLVLLRKRADKLPTHPPEVTHG